MVGPLSTYKDMKEATLEFLSLLTQAVEENDLIVESMFAPGRAMSHDPVTITWEPRITFVVINGRTTAILRKFAKDEQ